MAEHTNRLIDETSPYLLQHAHNPVDWYPWGEEAFEKARNENKPILLSIGYSACHWCHVMERESFESEETARLMNENFVNIKVDREERPDVDHIYMNAVQMLTGRGGWPLTVFLTPDGKPFYGGTYFPPEDRHGMPSFRRLLQSILTARQEKSGDVAQTVDRLMGALEQADSYQSSSQVPGGQLVVDAANKLAQAYDSEYGGLGQAPKFPNSGVFDLFLRAHQLTGEPVHLDRVLHTLRSMARGGIYDQLGGGFHRYSVDRQWLVPHFEKMLYDNAQLVSLYLAAYQVTGDLEFASVARETLDYVGREMRSREGGFYSSQDADSEGEEGRFFTWTPDEVRDVLGEEKAEIVCRYWNVTDAGNFEGRNILHVSLELEQLAQWARQDYGDLRLLIGEARARLFAARAKRVKPGRDDKILVSWNSLMISAYAKSAELFGEDSDRQAAIDAVAFIQAHLQHEDRLLSTYKDGRSRHNAYLDDYAFFIAALLDVYEAVQDRRYLAEAVRLAESLLEHFWDRSAGGFFFTSDDHEKLIVRSKPAFDGSIPSGNSVAVQCLLRLYHYLGEDKYVDRAEQTLRLFGEAMQRQPFAFANMLCALNFHAQKPVEIALLAKPGSPEADVLLEQIRRRYLPNRTLSVLDPDDPSQWPPILQGKTQVDGKPTVYVCHRMTCSPPATTWLDLEPLLSRAS